MEETTYFYVLLVVFVEKMESLFIPLDCGGERRLDKIAGILLDRPSPAAQQNKSNKAPWKEAHFCYVGKSMNCGKWQQMRELPPSLQHSWSSSGMGPLPPVQIAGLQVELRLNPSGQIGVFYEQQANWKLLSSSQAPTKLKFLNLFAYTGLSTLSALKAGHEVTHLDGAKSVVRWARKNAELSGLGGDSVRWIYEDALRFCRREVRRKNFYTAFILDPPAFGRGPKKESWKIERDLPELLKLLCELCQNRPRQILLSAHHPAWEAKILKEFLLRFFPGIEKRGQLQCYPLQEKFASGAELSPGFCVSFVATEHKNF